MNIHVAVSGLSGFSPQGNPHPSTRRENDSFGPDPHSAKTRPADQKIAYLTTQHGFVPGGCCHLGGRLIQYMTAETETLLDNCRVLIDSILCQDSASHFVLEDVRYLARILNVGLDDLQRPSLGKSSQSQKSKPASRDSIQYSPVVVEALATAEPSFPIFTLETGRVP